MNCRAVALLTLGILLPQGLSSAGAAPGSEGVVLETRTFNRSVPAVPYWPEFKRICGSRAVDRAAQCKAESGFNPRATSYCGAMGLMQFMPRTWDAYGRGKDPYEPVASIDAGHRYMLDLERQLATQAQAWGGYNAGTGSVRKAVRLAKLAGLTDADAWLIVLPRVTGKHASETQGYVLRIRKFIPQIRLQAGE